MSVLLKVIYRFIVIPYQNSNGNFHSNRTKDSKICMEQQNPDNQENLEKKRTKLAASHVLILNNISKL